MVTVCFEVWKCWPSSQQRLFDHRFFVRHAVSPYFINMVMGIPPLHSAAGAVRLVTEEM